MSILIGFEVKSFPAVRVIGKQATPLLDVDVENPVSDLWMQMSEDGALTFLAGMPELITPDPDTVGWIGEYDSSTNRFVYIAGVLVKPDTPVPGGFVMRDLPACHMGVATIQGTHADGDIYLGAHDHAWKAMEEHGYKYDYSAGGFEMEVYPHARFAAPAANGAQVVVMEYYSPCKKIEGI